MTGQGPLHIDWAPEVNLREADTFEKVATEVSSVNIAQGTVALDVISFTPNDPFEVLAVGLKVMTAITSDTITLAPARGSRQRHLFAYNVTTLDSFDVNGARAGDYFSIREYIRQNQAWQDDTNGHGGVVQGNIAHTWTIFDPGRDSSESPLVVGENDTIRVHKSIGAPGLSSAEEARQLVELYVWGEEVPIEETEVRTSFPSRGSGPSV